MIILGGVSGVAERHIVIAVPLECSNSLSPSEFNYLRESGSMARITPYISPSIYYDLRLLLRDSFMTFDSRHKNFLRLQIVCALCRRYLNFRNMYMICVFIVQQLLIKHHESNNQICFCVI